MREMVATFSFPRLKREQSFCVAIIAPNQNPPILKTENYTGQGFNRITFQGMVNADRTFPLA